MITANTNTNVETSGFCDDAPTLRLRSGWFHISTHSRWNQGPAFETSRHPDVIFISLLTEVSIYVVNLARIYDRCIIAVTWASIYGVYPACTCIQSIIFFLENKVTALSNLQHYQHCHSHQRDDKHHKHLHHQRGIITNDHYPEPVISLHHYHIAGSACFVCEEDSFLLVSGGKIGFHQSICGNTGWYITCGTKRMQFCCL